MHILRDPITLISEHFKLFLYWFRPFLLRNVSDRLKNAKLDALFCINIPWKNTLFSMSIRHISTPTIHQVKWLNGLGAQAGLIRKRLCVRISGVCCSQTMILTRLFLLISHEARSFGSWFFALHKGSCDFIPVHNFETEGRLGKRKESEISCRPRGLANNVESQRPLRLESPIERAAGREESLGSTT